MGKKGSNPGPPTNVKRAVNVTMSLREMAVAFTEWERRYREDPDRFTSETKKLLTKTPETCGDSCASYFMKLIMDVKSGEVTEAGE